MSRIENSLSRLEASLRAIIEGRNANEGIPRKLHNRLVHELTQAMLAGVEDRWTEGAPGMYHPAAPDKYTLIMPLETAQILISHPGELDLLAKILVETAAQKNIKLEEAPILRVVADPSTRELHVQVEFNRFGMGDSFTTELEDRQIEGHNQTNGRMTRAFLIVNGLSTYPLTQPVINIGSEPSNQLVINEAGISHKHAQLRFIEDRFVIFDLGSKNGSFVNGQAVSRHALSPGDVILLAGVPLVYGVEAEAERGYTQKMPGIPNTPEFL